MHLCVDSPCFRSDVAMLSAGQYQLQRYVGNHKALIVIDGVEDECKLVRLRMAPVSAEPLIAQKADNTSRRMRTHALTDKECGG